MLDVSLIPVLDNHCHFFSITNPDKPLHRVLTLSLNDMPDDQLRHTLLYRIIISSLAEVLRVPNTERQVLEARDDAMKRDYPAYVRMLMEDACLEGLVVDVGLQKTMVDNTTFEQIASSKIWYVYRTETIVDRLWRERVPVDEGLRIFRTETLEAVGTLGAIALKSIIGYRTGLEVDPATTASQVIGRMDEVSYRNFFFIESARLCRELGIPLHVHAAFGESNIDLRKNNPLHLKSFLDSTHATDIDVVLIHGGYPYAFEAGYLAAMYPRLHVDISELIPFATIDARRGVEQIMSIAPWNKIMYGSDGFDFAETHWIGAKMGKRIIGEILGDLVREGTVDTTYAEEVARMILHGNSQRLHGGLSLD